MKGYIITEARQIDITTKQTTQYKLSKANKRQVYQVIKKINNVSTYNLYFNTIVYYF